MEPQVAEYFAGLVALAQATFEHVEYTVDATPARAILRLQASYSSHQIFITELFSEGTRQYRYYVLQGDWVEAGFDNSPDPRAIRLKYGRIGKKHAGENVPHLHRADKTELSLTDEMTCPAFVEWLKANLHSKQTSD
ncbi:MAG: hypothetical protein HS114_37430 [Anaerolineales bacterium]|nr:hypothetical protein [Anaerolineales bacterium]